MHSEVEISATLTCFLKQSPMIIINFYETMFISHEQVIT
jgi:hypothetical protein